MNRSERRAQEAKLKKFFEERNKAFEEGDLEWARRNMPFTPSSDWVVEAAFHKARAGCEAISLAKRRESVAWLKANGSQMLPGQTPPPDVVN